MPRRGDAVRGMSTLSLPQYPIRKQGWAGGPGERELISYSVSAFPYRLLSENRMCSGNELQGQAGGCLHAPHEKKNAPCAEPGASQVSACQTPKGTGCVHFPTVSGKPCMLPVHSPPRGKVLGHPFVRANR